MKKFLITIVIFVLIFFIVEKAAYFILLKTSELQQNKKLEKIIAGEMDEALLVLGSSRGISDINAKQLQEETELSTYNISYRGGGIIFQEFIFRTYLKYNKAPQRLLLVIDSPYTFEVGGSLGFRFDHLFPLANNTWINNELIEKGKHSIASKFLYSLRLHNSQFNFNKVQISNEREIDSFGTQLLYGRASNFKSYKRRNRTGYDDLESEEKIDAFRKIGELCKKKNIELHYIFPPNLTPFNSSFYDRFLGELKPEAIVYVYDLDENLYSEETLYHDPSHLNEKGAEIFTSEISDYINALPENR